MITYTATCTNLYVLASFLIREHIPFEYRPTRAYCHKNHRNGYGGSVIDFTLEESTKHPCVTLDELLGRMEEKYGNTFNFKVIREFHYR